MKPVLVGVALVVLAGCGRDKPAEPTAPAANPVQNEMRLLTEAMRDTVSAIGLGDLSTIPHRLHEVHGARELTEKEGLFVGISSGSVVRAAIKAADRLEGEQHIVCLLADGGWKYLSSNLWTTDWEDQPEDVEHKIWW